MSKATRKRVHAVARELRHRGSQAKGDPVDQENPGDRLRAREAEQREHHFQPGKHVRVWPGPDWIEPAELEEFSDGLEPEEATRYTPGEADAVRAGLPPKMLMKLKASDEFARLRNLPQVVDVEVGVATFRRGTVIWVDLADGAEVLEAADELPEFIIVSGVVWPVLIRIGDDEIGPALAAAASSSENEKARVILEWANAIDRRQRSEDMLVSKMRHDPPHMPEEAKLLLQAITDEIAARKAAKEAIRHV